MGIRLDRRRAQALTRSFDKFEPDLRLDLVRNQFGPCPAAQEAIGMWHDSPGEALATTFRRRLSENHRVPFEAVHLLNGADCGLRAIARNHAGPFVVFPPSIVATQIAGASSSFEMVRIARGPGRHGIVGLDLAVDIPENGVAVIDSPSDPLGSILMPADAVRLSRACRYLVVDERFAEFSEFSLVPLGIELENVIILRSFESWAGLQNPSCAWAVASPRLAAALGLKQAILEPDTIAAAIATLNSQDSVHATLELIRQERSRLYRLLRKMSFLEPLPSWGPFLSARVVMVPRAVVVDELFARGIRIHAPPQPGLEQFIRIGIGTRPVMDRLRAALLELAPQFAQ